VLRKADEAWARLHCELCGRAHGRAWRHKPRLEGTAACCPAIWPHPHGQPCVARRLRAAAPHCRRDRRDLIQRRKWERDNRDWWSPETLQGGPSSKDTAGSARSGAFV
jgi:hypothetical protein